jgi:TetR/AcrR family transcriptional regulator, fatty acid metabolism regulator protein
LSDTAGKRIRLAPAERRERIIDAIVRVVAEHGVPEATTSRIAEAAGVGPGTLYRYFGSREEMLTVALEAVYEEIMRPWFEVDEPDALERIRQIGKHHSRVMASDEGGFAFPWVKFIAGASEVGLRDAVAETQRRAYGVVQEVFEEAQAQGSIRADADPVELTYQFLVYAWGENMCVLMGLNEFLGEARSMKILEHFLDQAAARPPKDG